MKRAGALPQNSPDFQNRDRQGADVPGSADNHSLTVAARIAAGCHVQAQRGHGAKPRAGMAAQRRLPLLGHGTLSLLLVLGAAAAVSAEPLSPARQREILRDALNAYDQAVSAARTEPDRAAQLYRQAAVGFHALSDAGVHNAALEYNLGNVHFRLGALGRALIHYRRAQQLSPTDPRLVANLRYARDRVEPAIAPSGERRLARQLLFWHYDTSLGERFSGLVLFSGLGYGVLFLWLRWRRRAVLLSSLVAVAMALAAGASLQRQIADEARRPPAVIVEAKQYLRLGRGEGSDLALKQPLGQGVELRILQQRGDWVEVRLPNDQTGWLPANAVERV